MKALVKTAPGPGNVALTDMPVPSPAPDQVLLEIEFCGICGTDLHVRDDTFRNFPPVILGHEFVGRVIEEGPAVRGLTRPDCNYAVLGAAAVTCGSCEYCSSGNFMFCPDRRGMGHGVHGAFARYAVARPDQLFALPDDVASLEGALIEPLAAAVAAVAENSVVRSGDVALVSGPGPIGLLCALVLLHQGIRTIVVGTAADTNRLNLAKTWGAWLTIDSSNENVDDLIHEVTKGRGVDVAFEVAGAPASAATCLRNLRPMGRYTQVGHFGREVNLPFDHLGFKQLQARGSVGYTKGTWRRTLQLVSAGLRPSKIVTHRFGLEDWEQGFSLFERKAALKVLLEPLDSK